MERKKVEKIRPIEFDPLCGKGPRVISSVVEFL